MKDSFDSERRSGDSFLSILIALKDVMVMGKTALCYEPIMP